MMNCQEALRLLYEIIDKEASEIDTQEVQRHLDNCRNCHEIYSVERAVQEFICQKLRGDNPARSHAALKEKICLRLDEVDRGSSSTENRPFFRRTAAVLAAAATIVIVIGGGYWAYHFYRHNAEYLPLERSHSAVSDHRSSFDDAAQTTATMAAVRNNLGYELAPAVAGFSLVGGQTEEIMGVEMAHFIYTQDDDLISVFVAPSDQFQIPDNLKDARVDKHRISFFDHNCRGCRLVYHKSGLAVIVTATTERSVELLDFIPGHAAI